MVFEKIIFHAIFAAESAHVVGDRIKPRVEAKPQPWVAHTTDMRAHVVGDRPQLKPKLYRPFHGLEPNNYDLTQGFTLGFMLSPTSWADFEQSLGNDTMVRLFFQRPLTPG
jgi:hypothetical protein